MRLLNLVAFAIAASALPTVTRAQSASQAGIPITVTTSPGVLSIQFSWPFDATATSYQVRRRFLGVSTWGNWQTISGGGTATAWTDVNVVMGPRFEYQFQKFGNPSALMFLASGVESVPIESRGKLVLLVDNTHIQALGLRLGRLIEDLTGDGWDVLRYDVSPSQSVPSVKALITAAANANPGQVRAVFLLGRIPVPYSGQIAPDGHPDHNGAWPADVYYGELNGPWTDTSVNTTSATRPENRNVPGDGKFDQSQLPSDVDLAVGRVDFANLPSFAVGEGALLANYLDKNHAYRHKAYAVSQRAVIDDNFGWFSGEAFAASGWRNFQALCGPSQVSAADYFTTLNVPSGPGHLWSYGCGSGWFQGAGGVGATTDFVSSQNRSIFTMLFGSYHGDWDSSDNFLRAALATGWTLTSCWAGRPHWTVHHMGIGEPIGVSARSSQNEALGGGFGGRSIHVALLGDPTLRQHIVAPAASLVVTDAWPAANLSWSPSPDAVAGYHVYRAATPAGPFIRLTAQPIANTAFVDPAALQGNATYMVRALALELSPSGNYWNLSQGIFATACLPMLPAAHTPLGAGCYTISDSLYDYFATPAAANAALAGNMLVLTPQNGRYTGSLAPAAFVPPTGAAQALLLGDDGQAAVPLPQPLPTPGGSSSTLHVHSNGIVALAPLAVPGGYAVPTAAGLLGEAAAAFYSWHDFDPTEPGSGDVTSELVGTTMHITWNSVESKPAGIANPGTLQFQFELGSGVVRIVWTNLPTIGTGSSTAPAEQFAVGWSPGGPSVDAGPTALASALPTTIANANALPLALSATPAPLSTATAGTLVTYTIDNVPEAAPGGGTRLGLLLLSFSGNPAGSSLQSLGLPGCSSYINTIAASLAFGGPAAAQTVPFQVPAGVTCGTELFAMAVALVVPGSLPNGQNPFGAVTSNGVRSLISPY